MRPLKVLNIALVAAILLLLINLIQPIGSIAGNFLDSFDRAEPKCYFSNEGALSEIPMDMCCYQVQNQLTCTTDGTLGLKCYVAEESPRFYLINQKAFSYCEKEGYDVKAE